jgi:hypothetical protein
MPTISIIVEDFVKKSIENQRNLVALTRSVGTNRTLRFFAYFFLDPLDVAATQGFDFAAKLEVAADKVVCQDAKAIDHGQRLSCPFDDIFGIQMEIRLMRDGQD